ncbi:MAG: fibronectin type III domain-containing protein, partial [Candidatus Oxydemutatoraceae bacterium WSBS_2016_MAG_OTU14]
TFTQTTNSITVSWSSTRPSVTSYAITLDGMSERVVDASQAGSTIFTSLDHSTAYMVDVIAQGDARKYRASDAYSQVVTTIALPLATAESVTASIESEVNIVVTWDAVENAEEYTVRLLESAGGITTEVGTQEISSPEVSYTFESNMPVTTYVAVVVASAVGFSASDEAMSTEIVTGKGTLAPVSAGQITTSSVTENSITLSWVASSAQANATEYVFTRDGGIEQAIAISAESYEITNLAADTLYTIMVIARGDTNQYNDSSALSIEVRTNRGAQAPGLRLRLRVFLEGPLQ